MRRKGRPKRQDETKPIKVPSKRGRPRVKKTEEDHDDVEPPIKRKRGRPRTIKREDGEDVNRDHSEFGQNEGTAPDPNYSLGLHMSTAQVQALSGLVACVDCGEEVVMGIRPTTKGMISEFTVSCKVCDSQKSTNTPNLIRERKRKHEKKGAVLQKTENINYAHVAAFLDNGLGYSGLRHYCKYFNARCLNEATFIAYAKQVISDVAADTEDFLQQNARIVRRAFESQLESDFIIDLTVGYTTTYHQWGSDFCLVAGAVIELQTGLVLDYDVANMYCHVCKINAKKIVSMNPSEMTEWFTKHQSTCEIREWCDEIDQDNEEGVKEIDPKYLESFIAKKIWCRSLEKFGFRYTTLIHESDERIHAEVLKSSPYDDVPVIIDTITNCFSRRKSEHARTAFQNKLKAKCPRERVQTKDRIVYVYAMSIPEYNKFTIGSNIRLRELVRRMEIEEREYEASVSSSDLFASIKDKETPEVYSHEMKEIGDAFEMERAGEEEQEQDTIEEESSLEEEEQEIPASNEEEEEEEEEMEVNDDEPESQDKKIVKKIEEEPVKKTSETDNSTDSSNKSDSQNANRTDKKKVIIITDKQHSKIVVSPKTNSSSKTTNGMKAKSGSSPSKRETTNEIQTVVLNDTTTTIVVERKADSVRSSPKKPILVNHPEKKVVPVMKSKAAVAENGHQSISSVKPKPIKTEVVKPFRVELDED